MLLNEYVKKFKRGTSVIIVDNQNRGIVAFRSETNDAVEYSKWKEPMSKFVAKVYNDGSILIAEK